MKRKKSQKKKKGVREPTIKRPRAIKFKVIKDGEWKKKKTELDRVIIEYNLVCQEVARRMPSISKYVTLKKSGERIKLSPGKRAGSPNDPLWEQWRIEFTKRGVPIDIESKRFSSFEKGWIVRLYMKKNVSIENIARRFGTVPEIIVLQLKRQGVDIKAEVPRRVKVNLHSQVMQQAIIQGRANYQSKMSNRQWNARMSRYKATTAMWHNQAAFIDEKEGCISLRTISSGGDEPYPEYKKEGVKLFLQIPTMTKYKCRRAKRLKKQGRLQDRYYLANKYLKRPYGAVTVQKQKRRGKRGMDYWVIITKEAEIKKPKGRRPNLGFISITPHYLAAIVTDKKKRLLTNPLIERFGERNYEWAHYNKLRDLHRKKRTWKKWHERRTENKRETLDHQLAFRVQQFFMQNGVKEAFVEEPKNLKETLMKEKKAEGKVGKARHAANRTLHGLPLSRIVRFCDYKLEEVGIETTKVQPIHTVGCHKCGLRTDKTKVSFSVPKIFKCQKCNNEINSEVNNVLYLAKNHNHLARGPVIQGRTLGNAGGGVSFTP